MLPAPIGRFRQRLGFLAIPILGFMRPKRRSFWNALRVRFSAVKSQSNERM
jgi:hypothetical protein